MKIKSPSRFVILTLFAFATLNLQLSVSFAQGTTFTYQGRLNSGNALAGGIYDFRFRAATDPMGNNFVGSPSFASAVSVSNGLFTAPVDFGAGIFNGASVWLQVEVRTNGGVGYIALYPLQLLTPSPYAITAGSVISGGIPSGIYSNAITFNNPANTFSGNGGGLDGLWKLGGNSNTVPATNFLGTTDNQPLELRVRGNRAFRLEPTATNGAINVIAGSPNNFVSNGIVGATVLGGGMQDYGGFAATNRVLASFGTVVGGYDNLASGLAATAMGASSTASGLAATALGTSTASGDHSTALGSSTASGIYATALGSSFASGTNSTAFGGASATAQYATATGQSSASGLAATAFGNSTASGTVATAMGNSKAIADIATAAGNSTASGLGSVALGYISTASGNYSFAAGNGCFATNYYSFALGKGARAYHPGAFVWEDSQAGNFSSTAGDQFLIRAAGGVGIGLNNPSAALHVSSAGNSPQVQITQQTAGDYTRLRMNVSGSPSWEMDVSGGATPSLSFWNASQRMTIDYSGNVTATTFTPSSDRNLKENFQPVDSHEVLDKVTALPLTRWNFKRETTKHLGPMAQDFYAAFGVGADDRHIATVDADGVALAAIKGLNEKVEDENQMTTAKIRKFETENSELRRELNEMKKAFKELSDKVNGGGQ